MRSDALSGGQAVEGLMEDFGAGMNLFKHMSL
jgi:hypothetical protein